MNKWQASIKLEFLKDSEGKTLLSRNLHQGPLVVQKPFYPEKACHIYLLHPPGGIAGCDHLQVEALLKEDTKVLITTPGATKFYKTDGQISEFNQVFKLNNGASLEYLPSQNIFYKGTHTKVNTSFYLEQNAKFAFRDVSKCGMKDEENPFLDSSFFNTIKIYQDNTLVLKETCFIEGMEDFKALAAIFNHPYIGTFICNKVSEDTLSKLQDLLDLNAYQASIGMVDNFLIARFLGDDNQSIENTIVEVWKTVREEVIGLPPCLPRIWST